MSIQLFSNNAKTTLAAGITSTQTTITVAPGTGSLFPNPSAGQQFKVTLVSASSSTVYEICNCTARSGDTLTVVRGQEGTSGQPFLLSDIVGHFDTAGVMTDLVQSEQYQSNYYTFAIAGGTANALTATLPSNLTALPDGMQIILSASAPNTGACTLALTLGSTILSPVPIVKGNNLPLTSGDIPVAGYPITMVYSNTLTSWILTDIAVDLTTYAPINNPTFTGTPAAPTAVISDNTTQLATTAFVQNNLVNYAKLFSPAFTGTPTAPTAANTVSNTQIATTAFASPGSSLGSGGYAKLAGGLILQWGTGVSSTNPGTYNEYATINFPITFPNACFGIVGTVTAGDDPSNGYKAACSTRSASPSSFQMIIERITSNGTWGTFWVALGY